MSCIYFHSRDDGEARLRGSERHLMGGLVNDLMVGLIGNGDWIEPYLSTEAKRYLDGPANRSCFHPWLLHDRSAHFIVDGKKVEPFYVALNTAIVLGNDAIKLAARLHGQCEVHCWVDGSNRAWLASIMRDGLDLSIFRAGMGWEGVIEFLGKSSAAPIVCSYSVCEKFPNFESLPAEHPIRLDAEQRTDDERFDPFYEMPPEDAWDACVQGLREQSGLLELSPEHWSEIRFGFGVSIFDLMNR